MPHRIPSRFSVSWQDFGREPVVAPNPQYPEGVDLNVTYGDGPTCLIGLPYPAKRVGAYVVECGQCGLRVAVTTAGRPDDPRSVLMSCKVARPAH